MGSGLAFRWVEYWTRIRDKGACFKILNCIVNITVQKVQFSLETYDRKQLRSGKQKDREGMAEEAVAHFRRLTLQIFLFT